MNNNKFVRKRHEPLRYYLILEDSVKCIHTGTFKLLSLLAYSKFIHIAWSDYH